MRESQHTSVAETTKAAADGCGLTRAELAMLWTLARQLQACSTLAEAAPLVAAAAAAADGRPAAFCQAVTDTVEPAVSSLREREQLQSLAIRDPLTGLYNRRFMEEELDRQLRQMQRVSQPLAVAMLDLDHFRDYNERYGHLAGDLVLQSLAVLLQGFRQGSDVPCRYGGEEFVLIMPAATAAQTVTRLEPMRLRLAEIGIHHEGRLLQPVTAPIGVAEFPRDGDGAAAVLDAADEAMYRAKRAGGNRISEATWDHD